MFWIIGGVLAYLVAGILSAAIMKHFDPDADPPVMLFTVAAWWAIWLILLAEFLDEVGFFAGLLVFLGIVLLLVCLAGLGVVVYHFIAPLL